MTEIHDMRWIYIGVFCINLLLIAAFGAPAQIAGTAFTTMLREKAGLNETDFSALERGEAVVKILRAQTKTEIAVFGIARLDPEKTAGVSITHFRDSLTQRKNSSMMAGGQLSVSPTIDDLQGLKLEKSDFKIIENCLTGDCFMRVSTGLLEKLRATPDRHGPDYQKQVENDYRQELFGFVTDYSARGIEALRLYDNPKRGSSLVDDHRKLVDRSPLLVDLTPEFARYLSGFPGEALPIHESTFNWSKISFGLKPVITITHSITYDGSSATAARYFVATRQVYASRYVDSSLALAALVDVPEEGPRKRYIIFTNISRSGELEGVFSGFKRSIVGDEAVRRVKEMLDNATNRLEAGRPTDNTSTELVNGPETNPSARGYYVMVGIFAIAAAMLVIIHLTRRSRTHSHKQSGREHRR